MARTNKINKTARVKKVKPNVNVEAETKNTIEAGAGCAQASFTPNPVPVQKLYHTQQIEYLLSTFLSEARANNRGESLLHIENARVHFESACQSLHLAEQSRRTL
jgi:hypothetical protein